MYRYYVPLFRHPLSDQLRSHRCFGRLVWSRGHSIENYLFDFEVVKQPLLDSSTNAIIAHKAIVVLQQHFSEIISIGCALGLAAREEGQLAVVRRTISWKMVQFKDGRLQWDTGGWESALIRHSNLNHLTQVRLIDGFRRWLEIASASLEDDVRWACDGHIGMDLIWAAYARTTYNIAQSVSEVKPSSTNQRDAILGVHDNIKFNHLARNWAAIRRSDENSPKFCLNMVGLLSVE